MDKELIIKYLSHTCSPDELKDVEQWILEDKSNSDWLFDAEQVWNLKNEIHYSDEKVLEEVYTRIVSENVLTEPKAKKKPRRPVLARHYGWQMGVAVVIVVLLVIDLFLPYSASSDAVSEEVVWNTILVPKGQRASVVLSDGTRINLNSGTTLRYPAKFTNMTRTVALEGEGFFEVAHNAALPFVVTTKLLNVKVLGTVFNLRAYALEQTEVTLAEGKVEVESSDRANKITMRPSEQVLYSEDKGMVLKQNLNAEIISSWTKGEGVYINKTLTDICADLERRFNMRIKIADSDLSQVAFTCHYQENATITQVLNLLKSTRKVNYRVEKDCIHIINP